MSVPNNPRDADREARALVEAKARRDRELLTHATDRELLTAIGNINKVLNTYEIGPDQFSTLCFGAAQVACEMARRGLSEHGNG